MSYRITYNEDSDGNAILRYHGDAQDLVDHCADYARDHREMGRFAANKPDMRKVMSVDPVVMMDICHKHGLDYFDPGVYEILKGRDYSKFRCVDDGLLWKTRRKK